MNSIHDSKDLSRRQFLALAATATGATLFANSFLAGWAQNNSEVDLADLDTQEIKTDTLVIGGGMAGLFAAVKAHDAGAKVLLVSKGRLGSSGETPFAKGIFGYDASQEELSLDAFVEQVSASAIETNNPVYTRQMAEHSMARIQELREWGFFDSPLYNKAFNKPLAERKIPLVERITITHLIKEKGRVVGAAGFSLDALKLYFFQAKSVILCTGAGGFKPNGFPICDLTHDGTIMAYDIGAKVTGKEWNDGHPGQATNAAACFDGWHGMFERKPGQVGVDVHHDLGVDLNYMAYKGGNPVSMGHPGASKSQTEIVGGPYVPKAFQHSGAEEHGGPKDGEKRPDSRRHGDEGGKPGGRPSGKRGGGERSEGGHLREWAGPQ